MNILKYLIFSVCLLLSRCTADPPGEDQVEINRTTADPCCNDDSINTRPQGPYLCEVTCPECGFKKTETMPTDICVLKYTCEKCKTDLRPREGDCCVYCSYGDHQCPSMQ